MSGRGKPSSATKKQESPNSGRKLPIPVVKVETKTSKQDHQDKKEVKDQSDQKEQKDAKKDPKDQKETKDKKDTTEATKGSKTPESLKRSASPSGKGGPTATKSALSQGKKSDKKGSSTPVEDKPPAQASEKKDETQPAQDSKEKKGTQLQGKQSAGASKNPVSFKTDSAKKEKVLPDDPAKKEKGLLDKQKSGTSGKKGDKKAAAEAVEEKSEETKPATADESEKKEDTDQKGLNLDKLIAQAKNSKEEKPQTTKKGHGKSPSKSSSKSPSKSAGTSPRAQKSLTQTPTRTKSRPTTAQWSGSRTPSRSSSPRKSDSRGRSRSPGRKSPTHVRSSPSGKRTRSRSKSPGKKSKSRSASKTKSPRSGSKVGHRISTRSHLSRSYSSRRKVRQSTTNIVVETVGRGCSSVTGKRILQRHLELIKLGYTAHIMPAQGIAFIGPVLLSDDVAILDLTGNNIRTVPNMIIQAPNLVELDLSRNGLRCNNAEDYTGLPPELAELKNLEILILCECNFAYLPPAIWHCLNLRVLDISRNKIGMIPPDIGNLEKLEHLNANQTSIDALPPEIAFCQELEELYMWGNSIDSLPDTLREMPKLKLVTMNFRCFARIVDNYMDNLLQKGQLKSEHIPNVLFDIPCLEVLDLEETKINNLPPTCQASLQELILRKNYFQKIPDMVLNIYSLTYLDFSYNKMATLPEDINWLLNLKVLKVTDNELVLLPDNIALLFELEELDLTHNQLDSIPPISTLHKLKYLFVPYNRLVTLPESVSRLPNLETLDATHNMIKALPFSFGGTLGLKTAHRFKHYQKYGLWLQKNPLTIPPPKIWQTQFPKRIYSYLDILKIKCTKNLQRQKLVLLGSPSAGKTALAQTLSSGQFSTTIPGVDSTVMVETYHWTTKNKVRYTIYDTGSCEIYVQNTLCLFLDPNALFLIVYDHRQYTPQMHYEHIGKWLDLLNLYCPGAVVKLVGTHNDLCSAEISATISNQVMDELTLNLQTHHDSVIALLEQIEQDEQRGDLDNRELSLLYLQREQLTRINNNPLRVNRQISLVSNRIGLAGFAQFINNIEVMAVNKALFPTAQKSIPASWHRLSRIMHRNKNIYITRPDMEKLREELGLKPKELEKCLKYFHDIGRIYNYKSNPLNRHLIFHRPSVLFGLIAALYNHNVDSILDYGSRLFKSGSDFTPETFADAHYQFKQSGQISKTLLNCFWFDLELTNEMCIRMIDMVPILDVCYATPTPQIPPPTGLFVPVLVIPSYCLDQADPREVAFHWPLYCPENIKQVSLILSFPMLFPSGLFEKISCRLQNRFLNRIDWRDTVIGSLPDARVILQRQLHPTSYDCEIILEVRARSTPALQTSFEEVITDVRNVLRLYKGLVWRIGIKSFEPKIEFPTNFFNSAPI